MSKTMFNSWQMQIVGNDNMLLMQSLIHQSWLIGDITEKEAEELKAMCEEKYNKSKVAKSASN